MRIEEQKEMGRNRCRSGSESFYAELVCLVTLLSSNDSPTLMQAVDRVASWCRPTRMLISEPDVAERGGVLMGKLANLAFYCVLSIGAVLTHVYVARPFTSAS